MNIGIDIDNVISNYKRKKVNVILDTDTYNECDDQFALSYLIKSKDLFNIEAITVAPYSHTKRNVKVKDGQELSYNEVEKLDIKVYFADAYAAWQGGFRTTCDQLYQCQRRNRCSVKNIEEACRRLQKRSPGF